MAFILRWPAILVLLALVLLSAMGALAGTAALTGAQIGVAQIAEVQASAENAGSGAISWIEVGLYAGAMIFFLISAIRLMRRTQGFWTWLLGFACWGGQWAYGQYAAGADVVAQIQGLNWNTYMQPQGLLTDLASTESQVAILGIVLVVGLFVFIVDAIDRAYWDREAA